MHFDFLKREYVDSLYALECLCFTVPWTKTAFVNDVTNENACYVLLIENDALIGYGAFWQAADSADITNVAVHPDYRKRGLGKQILEKLLCDAAARGVRQMYLEVRKSNMAAQALYTTCGFVSVGERKNYYTDNGEDAVIMEKQM